MIPVAALLILLVALFTLAVVINNNQPVALNPNGTFDLSIFGARVAVNELGLYCVGAGAMLVLVVALVFLRAGIRRYRISRRERRNLINAASGQAKIAHREPNARANPGLPGTVPGTSTGSTGSTSAGGTTAIISGSAADTDRTGSTEADRSASSAGAASTATDRTGDAGAGRSSASPTASAAAPPTASITSASSTPTSQSAHVTSTERARAADRPADTAPVAADPKPRKGLGARLRIPPMKSPPPES